MFADGILPGEGTSASENNSDGDEFSTKKAIARSKNKKRNARNAVSAIPTNDVNGTTDKENSDEKRVNFSERLIRYLSHIVVVLFFADDAQIRGHCPE